MLGFECFAPKKRNNLGVLNASLVIELIHSCLLIHDDIMDQDVIRRGRDAFHVQFANMHSEEKLKGSSAQYGISMGIDAGDVGTFLALNHLNQQDFSATKSRRAQDVITKTFLNTAIGQAQDIALQYEDAVTEEQIMAVYTYKTALYTVVCPLQLGAVLGTASDTDLYSLYQYGLPIGQAFQIVDDLLGICGTEEELGKPVGSDIKEAKKTLVMLKALELADVADRDFLLSVLGQELPDDKNLRDERIDHTQAVVRSSGAVTYCENLANKLSNQAKSYVSRITSDPRLQNLLEDFADYMVKRQS